MPGQLSFFSASVRPPEVDDLDGLLCGPGQAVRRERAARVSVLVAEDWRASALLRALSEVDLAGEAVPTDEGTTSVRTPFDLRLEPLAQRWVRGATKRAPVGLALDGARLRWWTIAAGRRDPHGWHLGLAPGEDQVWSGVGAALAAAGLPAAFVGPRAEGPAYRLVGARRLTRLRELVGEPPAEAPDGAWPDPA